MLKSPHFQFPFLEAAQAQKHLTVNHALARIDALSQLVLESDQLGRASNAKDGQCWFVAGGEGDFQNKDGMIAIYLNGGFEFIEPQAGWRAYIRDREEFCRFDGQAWRAVEAQSAGLSIKELIFDHTISTSPSQTTELIPDKAVVFGVTARVIEEITGTGVSSWKIGTSDSPDRYGSGLWLGVNGWSKGLTGTPMAYWSDTPLVISPDSGALEGGKLRIGIYYIDLPVPEEV